MIRQAVLVLALAALETSDASAEAVSSGIYGDVTYIEEAGDDLGMELELFRSGDQAHVDFVLCEGACGSMVRAPVRLTSNGFEFEYAEPLVDQNHRPAEPLHFVVTAKRAGKDLCVWIRQSGDPSGPPEKLKRLKRRHALAVAVRS